MTLPHHHTASTRSLLLTMAAVMLVVVSGIVMGGANRTVTACLIEADRALPLTAEIADTANKRARGLKYRDSLSPNHAMLFLYPEQQGADNTFWMHETRIPLTVAFFTRSGRIVSTQDMRPCKSQNASRCTKYPAGKPHNGAIEFNQGLLDTFGAGEGAHIKIGTGPQSAPCSLTRSIEYPE